MAVIVVGGLTTAWAAPAQATSLPYPDTITAQVTASSITSPCTGCPGSPALVVQQDEFFTLTLTLTAGGNPAAFNTATKVNLSATGPGALTVNSVTMLADTSSQPFQEKYTGGFTNDVTITATVAKGKGKSTVSPGDLYPFDVLKYVRIDQQHSGPFSYGTTSDGCATVSDTNPVCGIVTFQNGTVSNVLLAEGSCANIGCDTRGLVAEVVADMTGLYSADDPATLLIKCYRTVCGQGGKTKVQVFANTSGDGALVPSPACPAKGVVAPAPALPFCTDYVQSTRAGADLTLLYVLFYEDFRGSA